MDHAGSITEKLRALSRSPYDPELPRRSVLVDLLVSLDRKMANRPHRTPHLSGGTNFEKSQFEYEGASMFLKGVEHFLTLEDMRGKDVLDAGCGWGGKSVFFAERSDLLSL